MKLVALLLSFCISLNVLAANVSAQELEQAFDNYHYSLTVEWDQSDAVFKETQTKFFFEKLESLMAQGLTNDDINNFLEKKVSDHTVFSNIENEMNALASKATSLADLAALLNNHAADFYHRGASWNASRGQVAAIIVVISALFVYGVFFNLKYGCVQTIDGVKSYCTDDPSYNQLN